MAGPVIAMRKMLAVLGGKAMSEAERNKRIGRGNRKRFRSQMADDGDLRVAGSGADAECFFGAFGDRRN